MAQLVRPRDLGLGTHFWIWVCAQVTLSLSIVLDVFIVVDVHPGPQNILWLLMFLVLMLFHLFVSLFVVDSEGGY